MFSFALSCNTSHYLLVKQKLFYDQGSISGFNIEDRTLHAKYAGSIDVVLATIFASIAFLGLCGPLPPGVGIAFAVAGGVHLILSLLTIPIAIKKERFAQFCRKND